MPVRVPRSWSRAMSGFYDRAFDFRLAIELDHDMLEERPDNGSRIEPQATDLGALHGPPDSLARPVCA